MKQYSDTHEQVVWCLLRRRQHYAVDSIGAIDASPREPIHTWCRSQGLPHTHTKRSHQRTGASMRCPCNDKSCHRNLVPSQCHHPTVLFPCLRCYAPLRQRHHLCSIAMRCQTGPRQPAKPPCPLPLINSGASKVVRHRGMHAHVNLSYSPLLIVRCSLTQQGALQGSMQLTRDMCRQIISPSLCQQCSCPGRTSNMIAHSIQYPVTSMIAHSIQAYAALQAQLL